MSMTRMIQVASAVGLLGSALAVHAEVNVRISVKRIMDASGLPPAAGNLNTAAEVQTEIDWASRILALNESELRVTSLEVTDLTGVSQWFNVGASYINLTNLRATAVASPATYRWRTDAINVYITGVGVGAGYADFPATNYVFLSGTGTNTALMLAQNCANNPSCLLHEIGHVLSLWHTHQAGTVGSDECPDTILDNNAWRNNRELISTNNFGTDYASLTPAQQDQVDLVYNNVMSYHTSEPQLRFSTCQLDRLSRQSDIDRNWILTREAVYVDASAGGGGDGRYITPYNTLSAADSGGLDGKVTVLRAGNYPIGGAMTIDVQTELVPRLGSALIGNCAEHFYLPVAELHEADDPALRKAVHTFRVADAERRARLQAAEAVARRAQDNEADGADARARVLEVKRQNLADAVVELEQAAALAEGELQATLILEIAQRHRDAGDCDSASDYFEQVAALTQQPGLRDRALSEAKHCEALRALLHARPQRPDPDVP